MDPIRPSGDVAFDSNNQINRRHCCVSFERSKKNDKAIVMGQTSEIFTKIIA